MSFINMIVQSLIMFSHQSNMYYTQSKQHLKNFVSNNNINSVLKSINFFIRVDKSFEYPRRSRLIGFLSLSKIGVFYKQVSQRNHCVLLTKLISRIFCISCLKCRISCLVTPGLPNHYIETFVSNNPHPVGSD